MPEVDDPGLLHVDLDPGIFLYLAQPVFPAQDLESLALVLLLGPGQLLARVCAQQPVAQWPAGQLEVEAGGGMVADGGQGLEQGLQAGATTGCLCSSPPR